MNDRKAITQNRTNWAQDRTILANERTFSIWIGTGLGAVGVAIGLKAVFGAFEPAWAAKAVASLFLLTTIVIYRPAHNRTGKTYARLDETDAEALPARNIIHLAALMTLATVLTSAILWQF